MLRRNKKWLALLMSLIMLVSLLPTTAFAAAEQAADEPLLTAAEEPAVETEEPAAEAEETAVEAEEPAAEAEEPAAEAEEPAAEAEEPAAEAEEPAAAAEEPVVEAEDELVLEPNAVEEPLEHYSEEASVTMQTVASGRSSYEMLTGLVEGMFYGTAYPQDDHGATLSGNEKKVYDAMRPQIESVALNGGSTKFEFALDVLLDQTSWTEEDLGVPILSGSVINSDAKAKVLEWISCDTLAVVNALQADCPYEMYWFGNTYPVGLGYEKLDANYVNGEWVLSLIGPFEFALSVADNYSGGAYMVDATQAQRAATAAANAQTVVDNCADYGDEAKLNAYKDYICDWVEYNDYALEHPSMSNRDPWQMVYVFDEDPDTDVVCEGYSKAFQYLCDQSSFANAQSRLVSGDMRGGTGGGAHMWNVVELDGGRYLVDVTNCDEGTIGYPDQLFLAAPVSGSYSDGYVFDCSGDSITYTYDADTMNLFGENLLTLGETGTSEPEAVEIMVGETRTVTIENGGDSAWLKFTPQEDGTYVFYSEGHTANIAYLYDANKTELSKDVDFSGGGGNFSLKYPMTAGETYYYETRFYYGTATGSIQVGLNQIESGQCGDNATWSFDKSTGALTISGGDIWSYSDLDGTTDAPWASFKDDITEVWILNDGCTAIGEYAFAYLSNLTVVFMPDVMSIADGAFHGCSQLKDIDYDGTIDVFENIVSSGLDELNGCVVHCTDGDITLGTGTSEPEAVEITAGETRTVTIDNAGDSAWFVFTPEEDGVYVFSSSGDYDTCVELYGDSAGENTLAYDDNSGENNNFSLAYQMTAGTAYYYRTKLLSDDETGSFPVQLARDISEASPSKEEAIEILAGETRIARIENEGDSAWFVFTPEADGVYVFSSSGNYDTRVYLYDSQDFNNYLAEDDDSGENNNFSLAYQMTAGTVYYYETRFFSDGTGSFQVQLSDVIDSSYCGDDITWSFENGTLTLSGSGTTWSYGTDWDDDLGRNVSTAPWSAYSFQVTQVKVGEGITAAYDGILAWLPNVTTIELPAGFQYADINGCPSLTDINYNDLLANYYANCTLYMSDLSQDQVTIHCLDGEVLQCSIQQTVNEDRTAVTLTVVAANAGENVTLEYQWYYPDENWNDVPLSEGQSLTVTKDSPRDPNGSYYYRCSITASDGAYIRLETTVEARDLGGLYACGDDATWSFDEETGVLTISGSGELWYFWEQDEETGDYHSTAPWAEIADQVTEIVVENGITTLPLGAVSGMPQLTKLTVGESMWDIYVYGCGALTDLVYGGTCEQFADVSTWIDYGEFTDRISVHCADGDLLKGEIVSSVNEDRTAVTLTAKVRGVSAASLSYQWDYYTQDEDWNWIFLPIKGATDQSYVVTIDSPGAFNGEYRFRCRAQTADGRAVLLTSEWVRKQDLCGLEACGDNATWSFDESTGVLTISGSGAVWDYGYTYEMNSNIPRTTAPWADVSDRITGIVLEDGITGVGSQAFCALPQLSSFTGGAGLKSLSWYAFDRDSKLKTVTLPGSFERIDNYVFMDQVGLTIYFGGTMAQWTAVTQNGYDGDIEEYNSSLRYAVIVCTDGDIGEENAYRCGDDAWWSFDNGTLTITGTGAVDAWTDENGWTAPWADKIGQIKTVIVEEGITELRSGLLLESSAVRDIYLPASLETMNNAFLFCEDGFTVHYAGTRDDWEAMEAWAGWPCAAFLRAPVVCSDGTIAARDNLCGSNATWSYDASRKTLTITGTGEVWPYDTSVYTAFGIRETPASPWASVAGQVEVLVLDDGITNVLQNAFNKLVNLKQVTLTLPTSETEGYNPAFIVYPSAFGRCTKLTDVYVNASKERANDLYINDDNVPLLLATYHYTDGDLSYATSGQCGEEVSWALDTATGILTVSGTGPMYDYERATYENQTPNAAPWTPLRSMIKEIVVEDGVTRVGDYAFFNSWRTESVELGDTVESIGDEAFAYCSTIDTIRLPASLTSIGAEAFINAVSLRTIIYGGAEHQWPLIDIGVYNESLENAELDAQNGIHAWGEAARENEVPVGCENDGSYDLVVRCVYCSEIDDSRTEHVTIPALGHDWSEWAVTTAATCETAGVETRVCSHDESHVETREIPALGHDWDEGVVTTPATCSAEGVRTFTCRHDAGHTRTEAIDKIPHTPGSPVVENEVPATQTTEGSYDEVVYCSVCGEELSRVHKTTGLLHTHTAGEPVRENEVAPTCETAGGYDLVTYCTECGYPMGSEHVTIEALGHAWGEITYTWSANNSTATAERVCANDADHTQRETVNTTSEVTREATCEEAGETTYTAAFENEAFATQTKVVEIPALGHDWGEPSYVWAEDNSSVTATRTCARDASHTETETVNTTSEVTKAATCEGKGETTYTAAFENEAFATQTRTVENIEALGHDWGEITYTWAEDYSTVTATRTCANDASHVETETVNTTSEITKPATTTETGVMTYTAEFTNEAFENQTKEVELPILTYKLKETELSLVVGKSQTLTVLSEETGKPVGSDVKLRWSSADAGIATVDQNGKVTAVKAGNTVITVSTEDGSPIGECAVKTLFSDVTDASKFFYDPVYWAVENGITTGTTPATFAPNNGCTRGQIVTFLWRAEGEPEPTVSNPFTDIKSTDYCYKAVLWALENGITTGTTPTTFAPNSYCTREQCVTFLWRAAGKPTAGSSAGFTDVISGKYYEDAVNWAFSTGVTTGITATKFGVGLTCTRGQIVTFIYRAKT